jgi:predicted Kef-type K+ transport protein
MVPAASSCLRAFSSGMILKMSRSSFAFSPQYWSLRTRVIVLFALSKLSNLNGPVPVGCSFA